MLDVKIPLIAASMVCSAMALKVVHLPPAMVTSLLWLTWTIWFLAKDWVSSLLGSDTSGLIPLHADNTSPLLTESHSASITLKNSTLRTNINYLHGKVFCKANSYPVSLENPHLLWNPNIHYCTRNSLWLEQVGSQTWRQRMRTVCSTAFCH